MKKKLMTLQQHRLLKEAGRLIAFSERLKHAQKETTGRNREEREEKCRRSAKAASAVAALSGDIEEFLASRYDFRYNLLTDETEFRAAGQRSAAFTPVGKRELNTFCIEAHAEGIPCWDKDLSRYVYSTYIPAYHPFQLYMDELPDWDGKDRLTALACRVSSRPHWVRGFHTWMLGLASQWMGVSGLHANSVAPVLVSREQGRRKSSFCRALMPDVLARYYTDNLKLTSQGQAERMLAEMGLNPIVLERGGDVESRKTAIETFWNTGKLDVENNVQFGEGGAGTFSDGKLTTRIKDPRCRKVLEEMVDAGAPEEILYDAKPHIGTDLLRDVVKNIREKIKNGVEEIPAKVITKDSVKDITLYVKGLTEEEKTIILEGCLMNYYKAQNK